MGVRTNGQMGSADSPGKMDEKLKSENMQKRTVFTVRCYASAVLAMGLCLSVRLSVRRSVLPSVRDKSVFY